MHLDPEFIKSFCENLCRNKRTDTHTWKKHLRSFANAFVIIERPLTKSVSIGVIHRKTVEISNNNTRTCHVSICVQIFHLKIVCGCKHFHPYLFGYVPVGVRTDLILDLSTFTQNNLFYLLLLCAYFRLHDDWVFFCCDTVFFFYSRFVLCECVSSKSFIVLLVVWHLIAILEFVFYWIECHCLCVLMHILCLFTALNTLSFFFYRNVWILCDSIK